MNEMNVLKNSTNINHNRFEYMILFGSILRTCIYLFFPFYEGIDKWWRILCDYVPKGDSKLAPEFEIIILRKTYSMKRYKNNSTLIREKQSWWITKRKKRTNYYVMIYYAFKSMLVGFYTKPTSRLYKHEQFVWSCA